MPTLVIKDLPAELHRRLKREAEKAHRSMTKEAIHLLEVGIEQQTTPHSRPVAREIPAPYKGLKPITQKQLNKWKRDGLA